MPKKSIIAGFLILLASGGFIPAAPSDGSHVLGGSMNSPVRIEVFSDLQCPACRDLYLGTIKQVLMDYSSKDKVCIIYHEFPLTGHQYSREAAKYCIAASHLGIRSLLTAYDSLYTDQAQWSENGNLEATLAKAFPRSEFQKLKKMLKDPSIEKAIDRGVELGNKKDITHTPTMFIYYVGKEEKVQGALSYPSMKQYLDSIIK
jgi:protein-disulfide isomerase